MGSDARISLKKFYMSRILLFGFYFGVLLGMFSALITGIILRSITMPAGLMNFMASNIGSSSPFMLILSIAAIVFSLSFIVIIILGFVYNLISRAHGSLHVHLDEIDYY